MGGDVLSHMRAITCGRRQAGTGLSESVDHRVLVGRGVEDLGRKLRYLRRQDLIVSSGRGRNRKHALTAKGIGGKA